MKIEHQVAIIYCGVNELLRHVPVDKIKEFEKNSWKYWKLSTATCSTLSGMET